MAHDLDMDPDGPEPLETLPEAIEAEVEANLARFACGIHVELEDVEPAIWRRFLLPANATFFELHCAIQNAMGWTGSHLHSFECWDPVEGFLEIGIPPGDEEDDFLTQEVASGFEVLVGNFLTPASPRCHYEYDFGDGWRHRVEVEAWVPVDAEQSYPVMVDGERACPPEDCGGPPGYASFLQAIGDPKHEEHESMLEWVGGAFDPEAFSVGAVTFEDPEERVRLMTLRRHP